MEWIRRRRSEPELRIELCRLLVLGMDQDGANPDYLRGRQGPLQRIPQKSLAKPSTLKTEVNRQAGQQNYRHGVIRSSFADPLRNLRLLHRCGCQRVIADH